MFGNDGITLRDPGLLFDRAFRGVSFYKRRDVPRSTWQECPAGGAILRLRASAAFFERFQVPRCRAVSGRGGSQ